MKSGMFSTCLCGLSLGDLVTFNITKTCHLVNCVFVCVCLELIEQSKSFLFRVWYVLHVSAWSDTSVPVSVIGETLNLLSSFLNAGAELVQLLSRFTQHQRIHVQTSSLDVIFSEHDQD